jgi:hypothetical protein
VTLGTGEPFRTNALRRYEQGIAATTESTAVQIADTCPMQQTMKLHANAT